MGKLFILLVQEISIVVLYGYFLNIMKTTINNSAYLLSCECPSCGHILSRGYKTEEFYCRYCGEKLHAEAFSSKEIEDALFKSETDSYE